MTPAAKNALATTIRALRERLLADLHAATESAYRLSIRVQDAGLSEAAQARRRRLEGWIAEQRRAQPNAEIARDDDDFRREVEKQAAYTLLNRLVILRLMEAGRRLRHEKPLRPRSSPAAGRARPTRTFASSPRRWCAATRPRAMPFCFSWSSRIWPPTCPDCTVRRAWPIWCPIPTATLRHVVEALDDPELESCWTDDMTLGWVYQYWNDPEREALDAKLNARRQGRAARDRQQDADVHRALHGRLAAAEQPGPDVAGDVQEARLDARGRGRRHAGATGRAPRRVAGQARGGRGVADRADAAAHRRRAALGLLRAAADPRRRRRARARQRARPEDPRPGGGLRPLSGGRVRSVGSRLYREEARGIAGKVERRASGGIATGGSWQLRAEWTDRAIVERILEHNLHGIDLDPRAVQIAAAALWLKAQPTCARGPARAAQPGRLEPAAGEPAGRRPGAGRVAPRGGARDRDSRRADRHDRPCTARRRPSGQPAARSTRAVEEALERHDTELGRELPAQGDLFAGFAEPQRTCHSTATRRGRACWTGWKRFLARHTGGDDLGLRLRGEQLAAGVRFVRMVREGTLRPGRRQSAVPGHVQDGRRALRRSGTIRSARPISMPRFCCAGCSWFARVACRPCSPCATGCSSSSMRRCGRICWSGSICGRWGISIAVRSTMCRMRS